MPEAWLIAALVMGMLLIPVFRNLSNPEELRRCINRFLYVGIGSFVAMLVLASVMF